MGGGAFLFPYQIGVLEFLLDKFDVADVVIVGTSGGVYGSVPVSLFLFLFYQPYGKPHGDSDCTPPACYGNVHRVNGVAGVSITCVHRCLSDYWVED